MTRHIPLDEDTAAAMREWREEALSPRRYDCCDHCEHDINDPPHDVPCPEGCTEDETGASPWMP